MPIYTSEILKDDGGITTGIEQLKNLSKEYESFINSIKQQSIQLEKAVSNTNVATTSQRETLRATAQDVDVLQKEYSKYVKLLDANAIKIAGIKNAQQKLSKVNKLEAKLLTARAGSLEQLNTQLALNKIRLEQMAKANKTNTREGYELNKQTERLTLQIKEQKSEQKKAIKVRELERKAVESEIGSYDQLSAQYSLLKLELNGMSEEQRKNTSEGKKMEEQSAAIYSEMKRLQEVTGKHVLNVGNYSNSIVTAFQRQKELNAELKKTEKQFNELPDDIKKSEKAQKEYADSTAEITTEINELAAVSGKSAKDVDKLTSSQGSLLDEVSDLPGALGSAGDGVKGLGTKFKALLANPVVLVIGLIVGGLYALFNAFKQSEKGTKLLTKATGFINGIWSQTIALVDTLVIGIENIFDDPLGSIKAFGKGLVKNIVNRFVAIIDLAGAAGKALKSLWKGDLKGMKDAASDAGTALIKLNTGLDKQQQEDFAKAVKETTKNVIEETNAFIDLETAKRETANANREIAKSVERLITEEEKYKSIADDNTKSFKEREDAQKKADIATEKRGKRQVQIAKNNLSLINQDIDLKRSNGAAVDALLDQQLDAYKELKGAERDYLLSVRDNQKTTDELKQDRLERDLDILIDGFDNQKTINEKQIQDERKTFEQRSQLLDDTKALFEGSFEKQIETIQKFTGVQIKSNDLINESDAVVLNQKIRSLGLSEIIEGRLLEIIRDRRTGLQDLNEAEKELFETGRAKELENLAKKQEIAALEFELTKRTEEEKAAFVLEQKQETLNKIEELNTKFADVLPPIDTSVIKAQLKVLEKETLNAKGETALLLFDQQQEIAQNEFDLLKTSEFEKTEFRLNAEKDRLLKILELNKLFGKDMTKLQRAIIQSQIDGINQELSETGKGDINLYDMLGLNLDDEQQQAMTEALGYAKQQITEWAAFQTQLAEQKVQERNTEVQSAEAALQNEITNRNSNHAHKVETATKELDEAKKNQKAAIKERRRAQQIELAIQSVEQASSLVTASAKIWGKLGFPAAIPALGVMWGSFIAAKVRAFKETKKQFGKGTLQIIGNGSHASGNDTPLGFQVDGKDAYGERGEAHLILRKARTAQYKSLLPQIYNSLDRGSFERDFMNRSETATEMPIFNYSTDTGLMESELATIREQGEKSHYKDGNGNTVEVYKNLKTTYV